MDVFIIKLYLNLIIMRCLNRLGISFSRRCYSCDLWRNMSGYLYYLPTHLSQRSVRKLRILLYKFDRKMSRHIDILDNNFMSRNSAVCQYSTSSFTYLSRIALIEQSNEILFILRMLGIVQCLFKLQQTSNPSKPG